MVVNQQRKWPAGSGLRRESLVTSRDVYRDLTRLYLESTRYMAL